jgi:hypothetical protein
MRVLLRFCILFCMEVQFDPCRCYVNERRSIESERTTAYRWLLPIVSSIFSNHLTCKMLTLFLWLTRYVWLSKKVRLNRKKIYCDGWSWLQSSRSPGMVVTRRKNSKWKWNSKSINLYKVFLQSRINFLFI